MANYEAAARSNYFRIKDEAAFKDWCAKRQLTCWNNSSDLPSRQGLWAIAPDSSSEGGWPNYCYDEQTEKEEEFDVGTELIAHLAPGECAILLESGHEKLRYVTGYARLVTADGHDEFVDMERVIYEKAKALGYNPAEY